jgi:hypothetical protein
VGGNGCRGGRNEIGEWDSGGIQADAYARGQGGGGSCRHHIEHALMGAHQADEKHGEPVRSATDRPAGEAS